MSKGNGTRFIDKLIAASPTERRRFNLLGQDIYFRPLTRKALNDAMPKDNIERSPDYTGLFMLVQSAEHKDGSKVFKMTDIEALRTKVSLDLLQKLESEMLGAFAPSHEQVEQEAMADPPSASA